MDDFWLDAHFAEIRDKLRKDLYYIPIIYRPQMITLTIPDDEETNEDAPSNTEQPEC